MNRTLQIMRKQFGVNTDAKKGGFLSKVGNFFKLLGDPVDNAVSSLVNKWTASGLTGAEVAQNQFNAEQASLARQENRDLANTQYQRGVADMQAAGLNPALAYSQGGAPTPQSPVATSGSSSNGMDFQQLLSALMLPKQLEQMRSAINLQDKQAEKVVADTDNVRADTANKVADTANKQTSGEIMRLNLQFDREMYNARKESLDLANEKQRASIAIDREKVNEIIANVREISARTDNEVLKGYLLKAEEKLKNAEAYQIYALVPYQQALMSAQTDAAKAAASFSIVQTMIQQGLLDSGYVDAFIGNLESEMRMHANSADFTEMQKEFAALKLKIAKGEAMDTEDFSIFNFGSEAEKRIWNKALQKAYQLSTAVTGPLAGAAAALIK